MKLKRYIVACLLLTLYCATSAASAYLSISCRCVAPHKAAQGCCAHHAATAETDGATAFEGICCDNHHSTEIDLYRAPGDDGAVRLRCVVLDLPPQLAAGCPAPVLALSDSGPISSLAPPVMAGYGAAASLRAPPALV